MYNNVGMANREKQPKQERDDIRFPAPTISIQYQLEVFREDIPRAAQYVNSDSVLQQCILCRLDVAICLQSIKSGGFLKIFSKRL